MSNLFSASIGKKLIMSLSGLFLILFLLIHLIVNLMILVGPDAYNAAAHFMATNPMIKIIEPLLAVGFVIHILYASVLTIQNRNARPEKYAVRNDSESSAWASRNMYVLGALILTFLILHIADFYIKLKFGGNVAETDVNGTLTHDTYTLVVEKFKIWWFSAIYIIATIFLGFHLSHGFWSSFQTIGFSNAKWRTRLSTIGFIYALIISIGFSILPLYVLFFK